MSLLIRLGIRDITRRFIHSALFVLGVALGVAMVIAIDIANGSSSRAFELSTISVTGRATHQIIGGPAGLPSDVYRSVRVDLGIHDSAPVVTEFVRVDGANQPLRLLGVDTFAEPPFRSYLSAVEVDSGEVTAFDAIAAFIARPGSVLISEALAQRLGVTSGGALTIRTGTRISEVQVVGILKPEDRVSVQALGDLILTDIATAQELLDQPGRITRIDLILPEQDAASLIASIERRLPEGAQLVAASESGDTLSQMTAAFELNLQALSLLALVVGVFLIYNTVTFNVVQRRPILGILRSLGTTRRQVFASILGESLTLGAVGTLAGVGLGVIFGRAAVGLVAQTVSNLYFSVDVQGITVESFTLIKGVAVGLFASVGAAVVPAYDATRTPPAGAMRRSDQELDMRRLTPIITAAAAAMIALGLVLLALPTQSIIVSFAALFCIVVGGAFFTPAVLIVTMRLVEPVLARLFGVVGRMAPRAVERSISRTGVAVAALTIAVSVIVGVSVMISSFRSTVADWLETTLGADIYISSPLLAANGSTVDVDPMAAQTVAQTPGVAEVSTSRATSVLSPDYPDMLPVNVQAVTSDIAPNRGYVWNAAPNGDVPTAMRGGAVIVSEPFAFRRGITPERRAITLATDHGPQTFTIAAVYYDYSTDQGQVLILREVYDQYWDDPYVSSIAAFITPDASLDAVIADIRARLDGYDLSVQANRELRAGVFEVFDNTFAITIALRLLATIVAFIGILSALLSLQLENTRQFGILRATGMTPGQLWRYTLLQTGLMGGVAGLLALPIGLALAMVLLFVINVRSFGWTMQFYLSPEEFALAFGVAVVAALLAGIYPAYRISRLQTAYALRSE
ncbi:MAG: ABC transporter permease [Anaerolineae bacterium]|nr:ABC transporter permease [Anaerolineae bacterium]